MSRDVRMRGFRDRTAVPVAVALLERRVGPLGDEVTPITAADGRVAAADIAARYSVPQFTRSAMDGYALRAASTEGTPPVDDGGSARRSAELRPRAPVELRVIGDSMPGRPFDGTVAPGEAVRITTGAPLPAGADAVLMAELAEEIGREGARVVRALSAVPSGKHVGAIGEDVRAGDIVVARGRRLRPQDLGVLASVGVAEVPVIRRPTVRVVITGDELLPPGRAPEGAFIVDANSLMLEALARRDGAAAVNVVRVADRRERVRDAIAEAAEDVVLISGGSSVGPEDHAPLVLAEIGEVAVHGVALRPAGPAGFGFLADGRRPAFLLPGNPVSCLCAYELFAGPVIRALGGLPRAWPHPRTRGRLASAVTSELGRTDYLRVKLEGDRVIPLALRGASVLSSTTRADGVVLIAEEDAILAEGALVEVLLY